MRLLLDSHVVLRLATDDPAAMLVTKDAVLDRYDVPVLRVGAG